MDWNDPTMLINHNSDVILSNRILETELTVIEQQVGGYHFFKPIGKESVFYHYDSLGPAGSLPNVQAMFPEVYQKTVFFFEKILNIDIENRKNFWEEIAEKYES
jgi:hypothetical protein